MELLSSPDPPLLRPRPLDTGGDHVKVGCDCEESPGKRCRRRCLADPPKWPRVSTSTTAAPTAWNTWRSTSGPSNPSAAGGGCRPATSSSEPGNTTDGPAPPACQIAGPPLWSDLWPLLPSRRSKHTVVAYRDAIYVFGGDNGWAFLSVKHDGLHHLKPILTLIGRWCQSSGLDYLDWFLIVLFSI